MSIFFLALTWREEILIPLHQVIKPKNNGSIRLDAPAQLDGLKHDALVLDHMLINRSIHTKRAAF